MFKVWAPFAMVSVAMTGCIDIIGDGTSRESIVDNCVHEGGGVKHSRALVLIRLCRI